MELGLHDPGSLDDFVELRLYSFESGVFVRVEGFFYVPLLLIDCFLDLLNDAAPGGFVAKNCGGT